MLIDLQLHSAYSDGYLKPTKLADFIARQGVKIAALTDHNTVAGQLEFRSACKNRKVKSITGMELYVKFKSRKLNLLWYNFDDADFRLHDLLRETQVRRRAAMRRVLQKLQAIGFRFHIEKQLDKYNHYIAVNHIISNLMSYSTNFKKIKKELGTDCPREEEIIGKYFTNKKIAILRESYINIERIFKLRNKIGGQLVLCHPAKFSFVKKEMLSALKKMGLDGIEVLSPHHSYGAIMYLQHLARGLNFISTGGSDFHRYEGGSFTLQESWQYYKIDSDLLPGVKKIIG